MTSAVMILVVLAGGMCWWAPAWYRSWPVRALKITAALVGSGFFFGRAGSTRVGARLISTWRRATAWRLGAARCLGLAPAAGAATRDENNSSAVRPREIALWCIVYASRRGMLINLFHQYHVGHVPAQAQPPPLHQDGQ